MSDRLEERDRNVRPGEASSIEKGTPAVSAPDLAAGHRRGRIIPRIGALAIVATVVAAVAGTFVLYNAGHSPAAEGTSSPSASTIADLPSDSPSVVAPASPTETVSPTPTPTETPVATATRSAGFTPTGSMTVERSGYTATLLADGRVLVVGGDDAGTAELYDPKTGRFARTGSLREPRDSHSATLLPDGRVLVVGGVPTKGVALVPGESEGAGAARPARRWVGVLNSAELYDPASGEFTPTGSMAAGRDGHTATLLLDGRVLIAGGEIDPQTPAASAELYDPATSRFTPTGSMAVARAYHTATLLLDGRVLVAGGSDLLENALDSAELYDPKTGAFATTGPMLAARWSHAATLLANGRVLIGGGSAVSRTIVTAELYDPGSGYFAETGPTTEERYWDTATLLPDGRVLLAEGSSVKLYDPSTARFSSAGSTGFGIGSATSLRDGRVLITSWDDSAVLYDPSGD